MNNKQQRGYVSRVVYATAMREAAIITQSHKDQ